MKQLEKVLTRLLALCEYFNTITSNKCTDSNESLMNRFNYSNRKQLKRDLDRLQEMGYIQQKIKTATPVSLSQGTAKQLIRKYRTIHFKSHDNGLLAFPNKTKPGDILGVSVFNNQDVIYEREDKSGNDSLWIIGPDHTLIRNKMSHI